MSIPLNDPLVQNLMHKIGQRDEEIHELHRLLAERTRQRDSAQEELAWLMKEMGEEAQ